MKSVSIRKIDKALELKLKSTAKQNSMSMNQLILTLLNRSLGLRKEKTHTAEYTDLEFLFGFWSQSEFNEFEKNLGDFNKIDRDIW